MHVRSRKTKIGQELYCCNNFLRHINLNETYSANIVTWLLYC